jgi:glycosyltransferase involved in cell wall biosynthesis
MVNGDSRIELSGPVDDAIAEIGRARAAVVPLLSGSGTRVKIVEAWAAGTPVISTTVGAEGLPGEPGKHLRIADTPEDFARVVMEVLDSAALRQELAKNGRQLYEERLTWRAAWRTLENTGI